VTMTAELVHVRLANPSDLDYIMALQRRNRESVGGLPRPAFEERLARSAILLAAINGDPVGYIMFDRRGDLVRVPQACIQYDARLRRYGLALVGTMLNLHADASEVRLRCAADIDANIFWRSLGFTCVGTITGGTRRNRLLNLWQKWNDDSHRLFGPDAIGVAPAWQGREDCRDLETGFLTAAPAGFVDRGSLGRLAWSNRKGPSQ
jgi:hypothetical protein